MPVSFEANLAVADADIYLCGFGLEFPQDVTLGTIAALNASKRAYALPRVDLSVLGLEAEVVDLEVLYDAERDRSDTYERMADAVLSGAREAGPVALLTYGHPVVGMRATQVIVSQAELRGLRVAFVNAPSSIEAVCALAGIDPFSGIAIADADAFLACPYNFDEATTLLLMQVPYVGSATATHLTPDGPRWNSACLERLQHILTDRYGPDHPLTFVRAAILGHPEVLEAIRADELVARTPTSAATMVVPPSGVKSCPLPSP